MSCLSGKIKEYLFCLVHHCSFSELHEALEYNHKLDLYDLLKYVINL